nr:DUF2934 domain-containing protein [Ruegeria sp. HKCCA0370]
METIVKKQKIEESKIREAAYLFWLDEGQPEGREQEHWLKAEDALNVVLPKARTTRQVSAKPRGAKIKNASKNAAAKRSSTATTQKKSRAQ